MLETGLKQWLSSKDEPGDFYQLVGLPKLCRDQARLLAVFDEASEYLFACQNHKDKSTRDRAKAFQLQVAEARRIVTDPGRWNQYDQGVIERLRAACRQNPSFCGPAAKPDDLRRWLAFVQRVDAARVEELVEVLRSELQDKPARKPPAETQALSRDDLPTQVVGNPKRGVGRSEPTPPTAQPVLDPGRIGTASSPALPEVSVQKKDAPPPPRGAPTPTRGLVGKAPPPPPRESPKQNALPSIVIATQSAAPASHPLPSSAGPSNAALWVVLSVVGAIVFLLFVIVVIAFASGAFEDRRSRTDVPSGDSQAFCLYAPQNPQLARLTTAPREPQDFC